MKDILFFVLRWVAVAVLIAIAVVAMIGVLCYYQQAIAIVPASIMGICFVGSVMLINKA